tara:strand:- start:17823 stop:18071 length:249 start_codon:yes stop_codon:yes gene_type:complete
MINENIKLQALVQALDWFILVDKTEYRNEAMQITDKMRAYLRARVLKMEEKYTTEDLDTIIDLSNEIVLTLNKKEEEYVTIN